MWWLSLKLIVIISVWLEFVWGDAESRLIGWNSGLRFYLCPRVVPSAWSWSADMAWVDMFGWNVSWEFDISMFLSGSISISVSGCAFLCTCIPLVKALVAFRVFYRFLCFSTIWSSRWTTLRLLTLCSDVLVVSCSYNSSTREDTFGLFISTISKILNMAVLMYVSHVPCIYEHGDSLCDVRIILSEINMNKKACKVFPCY